MWFPGRVPAAKSNDIKKNLRNQNKCAFNNKILCLMTICQFFFTNYSKSHILFSEAKVRKTKTMGTSALCPQ